MDLAYLYLESLKYVEALKQTLEQQGNHQSETLVKVDQLKTCMKRAQNASRGIGLINVIMKPDWVYCAQFGNGSGESITEINFKSRLSLGLGKDRIIKNGPGEYNYRQPTSQEFKCGKYPLLQLDEGCLVGIDYQKEKPIEFYAGSTVTEFEQIFGRGGIRKVLPENSVIQENKEEK